MQSDLAGSLSVALCKIDLKHKNLAHDLFQIV